MRKQTTEIELSKEEIVIILQKHFAKEFSDVGVDANEVNVSFKIGTKYTDTYDAHGTPVLSGATLWGSKAI
jgi:hypothetical protein